MLKIILVPAVALAAVITSMPVSCESEAPFRVAEVAFICKVSEPRPPSMLSAPTKPMMVSLPEPATILSAPAPPVMESLPEPVVITKPSV